jgi:predicted transcriptional regulator
MVATTKALILQLVESLPDDITLEDVQYHLYVRQKIERGMADRAAGRTSPHEEVERRFNECLGK